MLLAEADAVASLGETAITVISTLVSTLIASFVAWLVAYQSDRSQERRSITERLLKIIDLGMDYPFLEDDAVCDKWPESGLEPHDRMRYDNYCCFVFNAMESVWIFCNGDRLTTRKFFHMDEMIWRHRCWWESEPENVSGYRQGFANFVNTTIERIRKEKTNGAASNSN